MRWRRSAWSSSIRPPRPSISPTAPLPCSGAFASFLIVVHWQWPYWMAYVLIPPLIGAVAALIEFLGSASASTRGHVHRRDRDGVPRHRFGGRLPADLQHRIAGGAGNVRGHAVRARPDHHHQGDTVGDCGGPGDRCGLRPAVPPRQDRARHARDGIQRPRRAALRLLGRRACTCLPGSSAAHWPA